MRRARRDFWDEMKMARFGIPNTGLGRAVSMLPLEWAWVGEFLQPVVYMRGVEYPNMMLATKAEIEVALRGSEL